MTTTAAKQHHPTVLSTAALEKRFGKFNWRPNGSSAIIIDQSWVAANVVTLSVPQLVGVPTYGGAFNGRVRWHRDAASQLLRAWADVEKAGLLHLVIHWGGSFVPRRIRGGSGLSRHSWATAFDINVEWNWLGATPAATGQKGSVRPLVPIFEAHGFCWGGNWRRADGMHFEVAEDRNYSAAEHVPDGKLVIDDRWQQALPIYIEDGIAYADVKELAPLIDSASGPHESQQVAVGQYLTALGYRVKWDGVLKKVFAHKVKMVTVAPAAEA